MKKTLTMEGTTARKIYPTATPELKAILEESFGREYFSTSGVWILTAGGKAVRPEQWNRYVATLGCKSDGVDDRPLGVGLVTESAAFQVHTGPSVVLQFGSPAVEKYRDVCLDEQSLDSEGATSAIIAAHEGVLCKYSDSGVFDFTGAPAAEWCRSLTGGTISAGTWALPTLAALKLIQTNTKEINAAIRRIGGHILTPGFHWSSTMRKPGSAYVVRMVNGYVSYRNKDIYNYVRAVSAFHIEDFEFLTF